MDFKTILGIALGFLTAEVVRRTVSARTKRKIKRTPKIWEIAGVRLPDPADSQWLKFSAKDRNKQDQEWIGYGARKGDTYFCVSGAGQLMIAGIAVSGTGKQADNYMDAVKAAYMNKQLGTAQPDLIKQLVSIVQGASDKPELCECCSQVRAAVAGHLLTDGDEK